jgi:hypothetical protein
VDRCSCQPFCTARAPFFSIAGAGPIVGRHYRGSGLRLAADAAVGAARRCFL